MSGLLDRRGTRAPSRRPVWIRVLATLGIVAVLLAACDGGGTPSPRPTPTPTSIPSIDSYSPKPNIVYVLTDDLTPNLLQYMPHVAGLMQTGMRFADYTVTDSLCCPSRSSILTGMFPHNTHVFTNGPTDGGFAIFHGRGDDKQTFATALQKVGYRTALMGKYLNGYNTGRFAKGVPGNYIPPGWSNWDVAGNGYQEFHYHLNQDGRIVSHGGAAKAYLTSVISGFGQDFIKKSVADRKPFLLEFATFAPHAPYTPAPQDRGTFPGLTAPKGPSFNQKPSHAPSWLKALPPLTRREIGAIDQAFVKRVEAVQSVDRAIGDLETTLRETGQLDNTVFVFNSDNGYHMGEHGLNRGKLTAFDTDIRVPLVVSGPGIPAGTVNSNVVENIDIAPTFEQLAGAPIPPSVDGRSLVPLLHGQKPVWRSVAAVEHHHPAPQRGDPDAQNAVSGDPPDYNAIRTATWKYVRYSTGDREYYDLRHDPDELHNVIGRLSPKRIIQLDQLMNRLVTCTGGTSCWAAAVPTTA